MGSYLIFILPALILSLFAQSKVKSTFARFSRVQSRSGIPADQVARELLERAGIRDVKVERISGQLTDHYDPRSKTVRLSESVYGSTSIAAIGVAAHETGHACQDDVGYVPLRFRSSFVPVANFGQKVAWPLIFVGFLLGQMGGFLVYLGIIMFSLAVIFQIVTLPVEFNASRRALENVEASGLLSRDETDSAAQVLKAAALTYVAAAAVSIGQLLYYLSRARR